MHPEKGTTDVVARIDSANTLLTVTTDLAQKLGLARGVASSAEALATDRNLTVAATLVPTAAIGAWIGAHLVTLIHADDLKRGFGGFLILLGVKLAFFK